MTIPLYINGPRLFFTNLRQHNWVQQLWSYSVHKNLGARLAFLLGPKWLMIMPLHICGQRQFHRTSDDTNQSSGCWVTESARIGGAQQAYLKILDGQMTLPLHTWAKIDPWNLKCCESTQQWMSYTVRKNWSAWQAWPNVPEAGKIPHHWPYIGWDGSMELEMALIVPVVLDLQHHQELGCLTGIPECARWTVAHLQTKMVPQNLK